jgi:DNA mismatch repair protein MutS2
MIRYFPESALTQLEFDKIRELLAAHCRSAYGREKALSLPIHTRKEIIERELLQSEEFRTLLQQGQYFPNEDSLNLSREIRLLGLPGAVLSAE